MSAVAGVVQPDGPHVIIPDVLAATSARLNARSWAAVRAGIPAWHPRNDGEAAPAATDGTGGDGGAGGDGAQAPDLGGDPFAKVLEVAVNDRDAVAAALKDAQGLITKRFQEAADFRKEWEPFGQLNLAEVGPDNVAQALSLAQLFANPAQAAELVADPARFEETWEAIGESMGFLEPAEGGSQQAAATTGDEEPPAWAKDLIAKVEQFDQSEQARQQEAVQRAADERVREQLDALRDEDGFDEPRVLQLAQVYALQGDQDAIAKGWADLQAILGGAERGLVEEKEQQPSPAEPGGQALTVPVKPKTYKEAREIIERRAAASA